MKKLVVIAVLILAVCVAFTMAHAAEKPKVPAKEGAAQQAQILPKKAAVDTNFDGKPDRTEYYDAEGRVTKVEIDANGDGIAEEMVMYQEGRPVKSARDTNGDGKPDVWMDF
jgi:hypothetical protein